MSYIGPENGTHQEPDSPYPSRRALLIGVVATGAAWVARNLFVGANPITGISYEQPGHGMGRGLLQHEGPPELLTGEYPPTFSDQRVEQVARELAINPGTYYRVSGETVTAMTGGAFLSPELSPTLPPAVLQHSEALLAAAKEAGVPVNVLATLATIESSGDANISNEDDAWGLLQVVPQYQLQDYVKRDFLPPEATLADYQAAKNGQPSKIKLAQYEAVFTNPLYNATVGADFLAQCIAVARANYPDLDPESPVIYAWAGSFYNAGASEAGKSFDELPTQAQLYSNHVIRILMDVEIAGRLRGKGLNDQEIIDGTVSEQMDARAYAYARIGAHLGRAFVMNNIAAYNRRAYNVGLPTPGKDSKGAFIRPYGRDAYRWYRDYFKGDTNIPTPSGQYIIPAAPGLRIWLEGGGESLFADEPVNVNWRD